CSTDRIFRKSLSQLKLGRGDPFDHVSLDLIPNLYIVEVYETDTTLEALPDLSDVVLEPLQGCDVAFPRNDTVANESGASLPADNSISNATARDGSDP